MAYNNQKMTTRATPTASNIMIATITPPVMTPAFPKISLVYALVLYCCTYALPLLPIVEGIPGKRIIVIIFKKVSITMHLTNPKFSFS